MFLQNTRHQIHTLEGNTLVDSEKQSIKFSTKTFDSEKKMRLCTLEIKRKGFKRNLGIKI